jgi:hypothetical protein
VKRTLIALAIPSILAGQTRDSIARARRSAIDSTMRILSTQYVSTDTARLINDRLRQRLQSGAYDSLTDSAFSIGVTADMRSVNHDLHLSFRRAAPQAAGGGPPARPFIGRVDVLDGNVGYVELLGIGAPTSENISALRAALDKVAKVKALIVDLRGNPGGAATMNDTLWSYFVADSQPTAIVFTRSTNTTIERFVRPRHDGVSFATIPIFCLTNGRTGSAAEGFAFFLQQTGRATVVGTASAGAGHQVAGFPVGDSYTIGVSIGRVRNARTGKEWERTGVIPNVRVDPDSALTRAHELAKRSTGAA